MKKIYEKKKNNKMNDNKMRRQQHKHTHTKKNKDLIEIENFKAAEIVC